jgi:hypothetical protein
MAHNPDVWSAEKASSFKAEFLEFLNHCYISSKESGVTCLGENIFGSQTRMLDYIFLGLQEGIHDFKCLKSRQLGCSTFARAFAIFWLGVHDGLRGAVILDTDMNKDSARLEIVNMIENLPSHINFPKIKAQNRYAITLENGSKLYFLAAGNKKGQSNNSLGASLGLNFVIASEMCSWGNEAGIEALKPSLSKIFPNRLFLWESTARGPNLWQDMWEEACEDDLTQRTIFLGWWSRTDQRLKRGTPLYAKYSEAELTDKELKRIEQVKKKYDVDIDMEQIAWIRQAYDPNLQLDADESEDPLKTQEQPWTEEEAFQITGSQFFAATRLTQAMQETASPNFQSYKFIHGTDFFNTRIEKARSLRDTQLKIWEDPVSDATYVIAADPAFGHNPENNNSAIQILRCYADKIEQVAEFADAETPTSQFAWVIGALCGYYGVGPNGTYKNNIEVIIEINGPGEAVLNAFKDLKTMVQAPHMRVEAIERGVKNIFQNVRNYMYQRSDSYSAGQALHFKTSSQLKEAIMERMRDFFYSNTLIIRSQSLLLEMQKIVRDGETIGAPGMQRDDRAISMAMGIRCWEDRLRRKMMQEGSTKNRDEERRKVTPADKFQIFNRNQLEGMFKRSDARRIQALRQARYQGWHR